MTTTTTPTATTAAPTSRQPRRRPAPLPSGACWPPPLRALPRTVTPIRHETYDSYLARLAAANHVELDLLDALADHDEADPDCLARLAALSGQPTGVLLRAIPELRHHQDINTAHLAGDGCPTPQPFINDIRPACRHCTTVAGAAPGTVAVWATHERNVCLHHQLWIGAGVEHPDQQIDLRALPDVVHAQIRHRRLLRRRGRDSVQEAFGVAEGWWPAILGEPGYSHHRDVRLTRAHVAGLDAAGHAWQALAQAIDYPEVVAFTAVLASPYWRSVLNTRNPADYQRLHTELCRRVGARHHEHANPRQLSYLRRDLDNAAHRRAETDPWPWPARWQQTMAAQMAGQARERTRGTPGSRTRVAP